VALLLREKPLAWSIMSRQDKPHTMNRHGVAIMSRQDKPHTMNKQDMVGIALAREAKGMMIELKVNI
jgi:hypothetical protein